MTPHQHDPAPTGLTARITLVRERPSDLTVGQFSSTIATTLTGTSLGQLDRWARNDIIVPAKPAAGIGSRRRWSTTDLYRVQLLAVCADCGHRVAPIARSLWFHHQSTDPSQWTTGNTLAVIDGSFTTAIPASDVERHIADHHRHDSHAPRLGQIDRRRPHPTPHRPVRRCSVNRLSNSPSSEAKGPELSRRSSRHQTRRRHPKRRRPTRQRPSRPMPYPHQPRPIGTTR